VRVVVYRHRTKHHQIARKYGIVHDRADCGDVERDAALSYLDEHIAELGGTITQEDDYDWRPLRDHLVATRAAIVRAPG
jgi:hypothetical protein